MSRTYHITAHCQVPGCPVETFDTLRSRMSYATGLGSERAIGKLPCPECGHQAPVIRMVEGPTERQAA